MRYALVIVALAGCYSPTYDNCAISCAQSGVCPSGLQCIDDVCRTSSGTCGGGSGIDDSGVVGSWRFRKKITFTTVPTVADFPALIRLGSEPDLANFAQMSGGDIRFETPAGARLPHEIERFVKSTGELVAWVKIPMLASGTSIYMYYGNIDAPAQEQPAAVWDGDYLGVWHLADAPGTSVADSTSLNRAGTKSSASGPGANDRGLIAGALSYSGVSGEFFAIGGSDLDTVSLSFEAWVFVSTSATLSSHSLLETPSSAAFHPGIQYVDPSPTIPDAGWDLQPSMPGTMMQRTEVGSLLLDQWSHVLFIFNGQSPQVTAYVNGTPRGVGPRNMSLASIASAMTIGGAAGNHVGLLGTLDEVRLSKAPRSLGYAQASFEFGKPNGAPYTFGSVETLP